MKRFAAIISTGILFLFMEMSGAVDYQEDIKPLLKSRCVSCHGPLKQKAGLRVDAGKWIHEGSKEGSILGDSGNLLARVLTQDEEERMPPEGARLSPTEIDTLKQWIKKGAPYPADERVAFSPKDHWAFQAVTRPPLPPVKDKSWIRNQIDHFVLSKLEAKSWKPSHRANQSVLLRRLYLDLVGLPPNLDEQASFADSPNLDKVIDDLLTRPGYGERWARHWLDAVRYADTNGYERDAIKPYVWRYRDYVIQSLNADKPYNRFLIEQLAGDELEEANAETVIATGFLRLGHWDDEPADPATDRFDQLDDVLGTTSLAMLGMTMGCARCHDHKFEPLTQKDYYQMLAVFDPLKRPRNGRSELAIPAGTRQEVEALEKRDAAIAAIEKRTAKLRGDYEQEFLASGKSRLTKMAVAAFLANPGKRSMEEKKLVKTHREALDAELLVAMPESLSGQIQKAEMEVIQLRGEVPDLPLAYAWEETGSNVPETHILIRGLPGRRGDAVQAAPPEILSTASRESSPAFEGRTTGRRFALAQWMVDPQNPLTARVIVNRVWRHHFGAGLVRTPNDFGLMGDPPTHPELLDWLAHWFVHDAGWSLKKLHRLILNSNTWQMAAHSNPAIAKEDPGNRFLSHQNYRRLEVEAIRDSILAVSGKLNREMYGPHTYPSVPAQALEGHSDPEKIWKALDEDSASRRTVYAFVKRSLMIPMLEVLDVCDTTQSSPGRRTTTVAPQALTLYNGEFANRQARHFASRLRTEAGKNPAAQIDLAYRLALCRPPGREETNAMLKFLEQESLEQLCRVLFNLNEFVYPD